MQGFEPRYYGPEPHVLPLDDTPTLWAAKYNESAIGGQPGLLRAGLPVDTGQSTKARINDNRSRRR